MTLSSRPSLNQHPTTETLPEPIAEFVSQWQTAIDTGNAELFNQAFAQDVLWGSPFGALVSGYDQIHAIHSRMFANSTPVPGASRYQVAAFSQPTADVAIVYLRRLAAVLPEQKEPSLGSAFDELALIVLTRKADKWWLAAAQHLPDRRDVYK